MKINIASLCLRFYTREGWTKQKVKKLLVNPKLEITFRKTLVSVLGNIDYYAVYGVAPNTTDHKIFKQSEIDKHELIDDFNFSGSDWYINKEK